jgi:nitric oxide reductase NorD protein
MRPDEERPDGFTFDLRLDGRPVAPPEELRSVVSSILQDLGEIPDEYLVPAGDGGYRPVRAGSERAEDVWKGTYHEQGAFLYNEWDFKRGHYRKNWCVLRELDVHPQRDDFVPRTLEKHRGLVKQLRKSFEALRGEDKMLKRQSNGDDIDIDALVEAYADVRSGMELTDRLFVKRHKLDRDIAVMFMVDMSGSTKGWINDAERESLVLLCEALDNLGDRYAIYGFSGITRKRCELYRIKRFNEPHSDAVKHRIGGMTPQDYTRMGVAIRHLSRLLSEVDAKTRLLVTLSDGKPDDYDGYRGDYGIEDTRQALIEAKQQGIHPFCITIDKEGREYLPHMYGAVNYALVDEVGKLPVKVGDIYRRLTC